MIYKHKHLKDIFLQQKTIRQITTQHPLILIVEKDQFLNRTISRCLINLQIPYTIKVLESHQLQRNKKNMGYMLPTLLFYNQILQTQQLVQFLCDASFGDDELIDFQSRKALVKQTALIWKQVFEFEKYYCHDYRNLQKIGVIDKKSYHNLIVQMLESLSKYFDGKIIQKAYANYSNQKQNLQNLLFVQVIEYILQKIPDSYVDYVLRGYFKNLIQISKTLKFNQNQLPVLSFIVHEVVIQQKSRPSQQIWQKFRLNYKKFLAFFGLMSTMFAIFAKP